MRPNLNPSEQAHLERVYTPSYFSKRFTAREQVIQYHYDFTENHLTEVRDKTLHETLSYGSSDAETMDVYSLSDTKSDAPIFLYIHGGYWQELSKEHATYSVLPLVRAGYKVFIIEYNLCPVVTLERLLDQIILGIEFILKYAEKNNSRFINLSGHSSGAHIILWCLNEFYSKKSQLKLSLINALYLICGVYDVQELRYTEVANKDNLLGLTDENVKKLSPICFDYTNWLKSGYAIKKIYIYTCEHEAPALIQQSRDMSVVLERELKIRDTFQFLDHIDHFDIVERLVDDQFSIIKTIIADL